MSYVVLARRLRPSRFDDLIGQETAAQTLRNAVLADRVAHAFLFAGSRGVGKTSAARILTRALNCLNPDNGDPCNTCENCVEINQNASPDVYEIDAASNRGIDNIRELRENVNYVPARCRYKVYIIDEAHMLTLESFNALLKTLEEPPPYVKFIFATTDPHKVPQTIISRCQRYDFLRIPVKTMADFLEKVVRDEKLELSRKALEMIARNSVGGMRDALTAIDQILSFTGTTASDQKVAQILGILDSESRFAFLEALLKKNEGEALRYFQELQEHGHDAHDILSDLLQTIKTTALVRTLGTNQALFQDISSDDLEVFATLAKVVSANELQQIFHILLELEEQMKRSTHTKICFEMVILQIASIEPLVGLPEIISEIQNIRSGEPPAAANTANSASASIVSAESPVSGTDDSAGNHQQSESAKSGYKKQIVDASVIRNILQSGTGKPPEKAHRPSKAVDSVQEPPVTQIKDPEQKDFTQINEDSSYVAETAFYPEKTEEVENLTQVISPATSSANSPAFSAATSPEIPPAIFPESSTENSPETQAASVETTDNEKGDVLHNSVETVEKPPTEWSDFSAEVKKRSPLLASFIRNAVPQSLAGSQLKLGYKNGKYASMFTEQNRELLETIASEWCGHAVHVSCEITPIVTSMQTIVECEQILLEQKKELKRKNAREFPQVKDILSVFTNSKITAIEFADA
ncbi:MAG TPA: DNA polymerase III subunit gamma/tau [Candidatus Lambdaproteobacteria bacterium]|nr:DNA polymerase III subunit gamma/tau [Candidatus Lambdaproteobacteria bacterium]HIO82774.1 DNA polymerase III subunit gamma/tau [Deltaproteobacteria bacterium]